MNKQRFILLLAAAALIVVGLGRGAPAQDAMDDGGYAPSSETCAACHDDQVAAFQNNPHALLDSPEWTGAGSCVSCHGDGTQHIEEGGGAGSIFAFGGDELATARSQACQQCHGDSHPRFAASPHALAGLACTDCHSIHSAGATTVSQLIDSGNAAEFGLKDGSISATCADCHSNVFAQFEFTERHRLQEGIMDCTSCHNPHEPSTRMMLGGFKQEACVDCHTDKGGPFVFEHGAQRVEGCTACHTPHGSPNRHMLKFQLVAEQCFSCHAAVPGFHSRFTLESQCTNCHSTIHGSNFDPAFLK